MPFTPSTAVYLCNVPLEMDQKNQLDFADATVQHLYFSNNIKKSYSSFTYQRKDNVLRVPECIDDLWNCNYVMYQNSNFGSKWFYCFIDHMEYVNPNCTALYLKTDVFQTWIFDATLLSSFVAREHVADDTEWLHTLPEPIGQLQYNYTQRYSKVFDSAPDSSVTTWTYCAYAVPDDGKDKIRPAEDVQGSYVDVTNLITIGHLRCPGYLFGTSSTAIFKEMIEQLIHDNYNIVYTVAIPTSALVSYLAVEWNNTFQTTVYNFRIYSDRNTDESISLTDIDTTTIGSYTIKNKKINCYPYRSCCIADDNEQTVDLKYELLGNSRTSFNIKYCIGSAPAVLLYPATYEGKALDYSHGLSLSSFPPVPYSIDYFRQYLALHKSSFEMDVINSTFNTVSSISANVAAGNAAGAAGNMLNYMSGLARYEDMQAAPPTVRGVPSGVSKFTSNGLRFRIYDKTPRPEYLVEVDNFFDKYGYNVSIVKVPQYNSRPAWNYLETKEINISGNVPQDDMQELKNIFNSGVTIWHDPAHFGDYSQNNAPT